MKSASRSSAFTLITSAFTLIELLVVIAIIALLAAILFPVFSQAREKARQASCMSNLKNVGDAMLMYSQDYDEYIMPNCVQYYPPGGAAQPILTYWFGQYVTSTAATDDTKGLLYPYTKNVPIQECIDAASIPNGSTINENGIGYGYNSAISGVVGGSPDPAGGSTTVTGFLLQSSITSPADTMLLADSANSNTAGMVIRYPTVAPPYTYNPISGYGSTLGSLGIGAHALHNGMCDVLWLDGHVKAMPLALPPTSTGTGNRSLGFAIAHNFGFLVKGGALTGVAATDLPNADYYFVWNK